MHKSSIWFQSERAFFSSSEMQIKSVNFASKSITAFDSNLQIMTLVKRG